VLARLSPRAGEFARLVIVEGWRTDEVGAHFGCSARYVSTALSRVRRAIQQELAAHAQAWTAGKACQRR
jgi:DNA-directed RNA polymerase specialized sigma24 family protein